MGKWTRRIIAHLKMNSYTRIVHLNTFEVIMGHKDKDFKPVVSIVIPTYNQVDKTVQCFASIRAHTKLPYEIVWVDNGSAPDNVKIMRRQATRPRMHCKLIRNSKNLGFIKATNQGIRESEGEYIILLNNDTEVSARWATTLIKPLMNDPKVGIVGPVTNSKIAWQEAENLNRRWPDLGMPGYTADINKYAEILGKKFKGRYMDVGKNPLSFFCAAFRRSIFDELGCLDTDFNLGLGDDDHYCMIARHAGYKLMLSLETFVLHHHRTTFKALKLDVDSLQRTAQKTLRRKKKELAAQDK